jgi:hypothetical protein
MKEGYIILLHDLEDVCFFLTKDDELFETARNADDLCEWVNDNIDSLDNLGDDISGITVIDITYGLQY